MFRGRGSVACSKGSVAHRWEPTRLKDRRGWPRGYAWVLAASTISLQQAKPQRLLPIHHPCLGSPSGRAGRTSGESALPAPHGCGGCQQQPGSRQARAPARGGPEAGFRSVGFSRAVASVVRPLVDGVELSKLEVVTKPLVLCTYGA